MRNLWVDLLWCRYRCRGSYAALPKPGQMNLLAKLNPSPRGTAMDFSLGCSTPSLALNFNFPTGLEEMGTTAPAALNLLFTRDGGEETPLRSLFFSPLRFPTIFCPRKNCQRPSRVKSFSCVYLQQLLGGFCISSQHTRTQFLPDIGHRRRRALS